MHARLLVAAIAIGALGVAPALAQDAAAGKSVFQAQCAICHATVAGKNGLGPSLFAVYGTKAGEVAGFRFSDANKKSGLTWDTPTLDKYLTSPPTVVPGTTMAFAGLKDAQKRADLIAYLQSLR